MPYKLKLPPDSRVRPVFHVSPLNKVIGDYSPQGYFNYGIGGSVGRFSCVLASREITRGGSPIGSSLLCGKEILIMILLGSMNLFDKDNF